MITRAPTHELTLKVREIEREGMCVCVLNEGKDVVRLIGQNKIRNVLPSPIADFISGLRHVVNSALTIFPSFSLET